MSNARQSATLGGSVDYLPMARSVVHLISWGSAAVWEPSYHKGARPLVVLSEGRDLSLLSGVGDRT